MSKPLEWSTEKRKVNDLLPFELNPRKISDERKWKMIESIQKWNLAEIPAINRDNTIIAGHQRLKALQVVGRGEEEVDVRVPNRMLTQKELKEYAVMSNTHFGEWDFEMLEQDFADIDFNVLPVTLEDLRPFDLDPVQDKAIVAEAKEDDFEVPEGGIETDIVEGDLIEIGVHRLLCGSSTEADSVIKLLGGGNPNIMVTDPPYGVKLDQTWRNGIGDQKHNGNRNLVKNDDIADWTESYSLFTGTIAYVWHASKFTDVIMKNLRDCKFEPNQQLILNKSVMVMGRNDYHFKHEPCWYAVRKGSNHSWIGGRKNVTVIDAVMPSARAQKSTEDRTEHPTQKPVVCMGIPIKNHSGDVYDPFAGSGTTMVAAQQLNRKSYCMELDPKYCQVIVNRMRKMDPTLEIKRNGQPWIIPTNS